MNKVKTFMTSILQVLFCGETQEGLICHFSEDVCAVCIAKGKKSIGRDEVLKTLLPERSPFLRCAMGW